MARFEIRQRDRDLAERTNGISWEARRRQEGTEVRRENAGQNKKAVTLVML
jgi:hypothetical protein